MAKTIWKFPIEMADRQVVKMPTGAKILYVGPQAETVCLWVQVDPAAEKQDREIRIYGTGHSIDGDPGRYIGTFMLGGGAFVFHAYESHASSADDA